MIDRSIRLACDHCDRDDHDGISPAELDGAIRDGWQDVDGPDADQWPDGDDDLGWWTHMGTCPDCAKAEAPERQGVLF